MATTAHLGITLLEAAQAQKEITVNEALARIDAVMNAGVIDRDLATPPGSPVTGDVYIVAAAATGDWTGHSGHVAYFDQIWRFIVPVEGLTLWVNDENVHYVFNGTVWEQMPGVNTTQTFSNKTYNGGTLNGTFAGSASFTGNNAFVVSSGTGLRVTNTGSGDSLLVEDSANPDSTPFVINASGQTIVGHTATLTVAGAATAGLQVYGTGGNAFINQGRFANNNLPPYFNFLKSRSGTIGGFTVVQSADQVGDLNWCADDGVDYESVAARIRVEIDGTPGSNDMPGRMQLQTTADGAASPTTRLSISNAGAVAFPSISTTASAANAFLDSAASNNLLRSTSSLHYKRDVETLEPAYAQGIYGLRPVWYRSKAVADNPEWSWYGLIAEEVAEIEPRLVHWAYPVIGEDEEGAAIYGEEKLPGGVQYERLSVLLLVEIQRLRAEVDALKEAVHG